jgi:hypothetical protein
MLNNKLLPLMILLLITASSASQAAQWVPTPEPLVTPTGSYHAGGGCCSWVEWDADFMLFFDVWSGSWTELVLPETHDYITTLGEGHLILVITSDLVVAFNGPPGTVHVQPLDGDLLSTSTLRPSYDCAGELAVVTTDAAFYVFDARMDQWRILHYDYPAGYSTHNGTLAESDYVVTEIQRSYPERAINLAYSGRLRAFAQTETGVNDVLSYQNLDHGFAGRSGFVADFWGVGYSAFTNQFSVIVPPGDSNDLSSSTISRQQKDLSHLWGTSCIENLGGLDRRCHLWVYDTITGSWIHEQYDHVYLGETFGPVFNGGRFAAFHRYRNSDATNWAGVFSGETHAVDFRELLLPDNNPAFISGGSVGGVGSPSSPGGWDLNWWFYSLEYPVGQTLTLSRPYTYAHVAGEEWICLGNGINDEPLMDVYFYHGPSNAITSLQTWFASGNWNVDGTHIHLLVTSGDDIDVIFYSGYLNSVARGDLPSSATPLTMRINDNLGLVFYNGVGDFFYDARTGVMHQRGIDYSPTFSLGADVCMGFDPVTYEAHGYSGVSGQWSTVNMGADSYVYAGGLVGVTRLLDGSRFYGLSALDGSWTELVPTGSTPSQQAGEQTAVVYTTERLWAFWPFDAVPVRESDRHEPLLTHALQQIRCHPNPFNGRTVVECDLPVAADVKIEVLDLRGRRVTTLLQEQRPPGLVSVVWQTEHIASGTYLVRLEADGLAVTRKLTLVQ